MMDLVVLVLIVGLSIYTTFLYYGMQQRVADTWEACDMWYEQNCDCSCGDSMYPMDDFNISMIHNLPGIVRGEIG